MLFRQILYQVKNTQEKHLQSERHITLLLYIWSLREVTSVREAMHLQVSIILYKLEDVEYFITLSSSPISQVSDCPGNNWSCSLNTNEFSEPSRSIGNQAETKTLGRILKHTSIGLISHQRASSCVLVNFAHILQSQGPSHTLSSHCPEQVTLVSIFNFTDHFLNVSLFILRGRARAHKGQREKERIRSRLRAVCAEPDTQLKLKNCEIIT